MHVFFPVFSMHVHQYWICLGIQRGGISHPEYGAMHGMTYLVANDAVIVSCQAIDYFLVCLSHCHTAMAQLPSTQSYTAMDAWHLLVTPLFYKYSNHCLLYSG